MVDSTLKLVDELSPTETVRNVLGDLNVVDEEAFYDVKIDGTREMLRPGEDENLNSVVLRMTEEIEKLENDNKEMKLKFEADILLLQKENEELKSHCINNYTIIQESCQPRALGRN